jgi:hypothetical protein
MDGSGRVVWSDNGLAVAELGTLSLFLIAQPLTLPRLQQMRRIGEDHHARFGSHRASLSIGEPSAIMDMPKPVREQASLMVRDLSSEISAAVLEGGGFKAVAGRAIITGLWLMAGRAGSNKVFTDLDTATAWLAPRIPPAGDGEAPISIATLDKLVESARAAIKREPAGP